MRQCCKVKSVMVESWRQEDIPGRSVALADASDRVASEANLAGHGLGPETEERVDNVPLVVVHLLEAVAALNGAGVAAVLGRELRGGGDRNDGDGESEDGSELGEHRESRRKKCERMQLLAGDSGRPRAPFMPTTLSASVRFGSATDAPEIEYRLLFRFKNKKTQHMWFRAPR